MNDIRKMLESEAAEARAVADEEERGEREPAPAQRARRQATDPSQVYSVRIPVDRLAQLRALADERGETPSALLRRFVLERLDRESMPPQVEELPERDPHELRLGQSRRAPMAEVVRLPRPEPSRRLQPNHDKAAQ